MSGPEDLAQANVCRRVAAGESLPSICRDEAMPDLVAVTGWLAEGAAGGFRVRLNKAQALRREILAEQILDIGDRVGSDTEGPSDSENKGLDRDALALAKLRIETRKILIARTEDGSSAPAEAGVVGALRDMLDALDGRDRGLPVGKGEKPLPAGLFLERRGRTEWFTDGSDSRESDG